MSIFNGLKGLSYLIRKEIVATRIVRGFYSEEERLRISRIPAEQRRINFDTKLRYMKSNAYKETYGDLPVWTVYVRNFKGSFPPPPRKSCIFAGKMKTGSPCPICRDKYLIVNYKNIDLLKQFISPHGGEIISNKKTGVCQKQHFRIKLSIHKAKDLGWISFDVPFRKYDYSVYIK